MKKEELPSIEKMLKEIKIMSLFKFLMPPEQRKLFNETKVGIQKMIDEAIKFNERFSDFGWCLYDYMNPKVVEKANKAFDDEGIEAAEKLLIEYYKTDVKDIVHKIKNSSNAFLIRSHLIEQFLNDHFSERYYSSVLLALVIIDGAVNDFTKEKGFFAEGTNVDAWDCLVGCSDGLAKLKTIFNKSRTTTNLEKITLPYRNGILYGRDLNYANEYVSCKCLALMLCVADWMKKKNSEERRKEKFDRENNPPPVSESLKKYEQAKIAQKEIHEWTAKTITIGIDIPETGEVDDYENCQYVKPVVEMIYAWKNKNYGKLAQCLEGRYGKGHSLKVQAGECRKMFCNKELQSFKIIDVVEETCCLSRVIVDVDIKIGEIKKEETLVFGCWYKGDSPCALPWNNNGEWIIIPRDTKGLF